jgi:hypothetical protein
MSRSVRHESCLLTGSILNQPAYVRPQIPRHCPEGLTPILEWGRLQTWDPPTNRAWGCPRNAVCDYLSEIETGVTMPSVMRVFSSISTEL